MSKTITKPWGKYILMQKGRGYWIKKLFIKKGARISLQSHKNRSEIWVVLSGKVEVIKGKSRIVLRKEAFLQIDKREKHRIAGLRDSWILEVAFGKVLERDIIRFEDDYGRIK